MRCILHGHRFSEERGRGEHKDRRALICQDCGLVEREWTETKEADDGPLQRQN